MIELDLKWLWLFSSYFILFKDEDLYIISSLQYTYCDYQIIIIFGKALPLNRIITMAMIHVVSLTVAREVYWRFSDSQDTVLEIKNNSGRILVEVSYNHNLFITIYCRNIFPWLEFAFKLRQQHRTQLWNFVFNLPWEKQSHQMKNKNKKNVLKISLLQSAFSYFCVLLEVSNITWKLACINDMNANVTTKS